MCFSLLRGVFLRVRHYSRCAQIMVSQSLQSKMAAQINTCIPVHNNRPGESFAIRKIDFPTLGKILLLVEKVQSRVLTSSFFIVSMNLKSNSKTMTRLNKKQKYVCMYKCFNCFVILILIIHG